MAENDISKVSEALKKIGVGGITVLKVKGERKGYTS
jgi:nitrogen regulatory protein PII